MRMSGALSPLDVLGLPELMKRTAGHPNVTVGVLDGPVAIGHPELAEARMRILGNGDARCTDAESHACRHGTFIAGVLFARRDGAAPGICAECSSLVVPIFGEHAAATPTRLAAAISAVVRAGARLINLSAGPQSLSSNTDHELEPALDFAAQHGVVVVAAAGNQGMLGSSAITRHPAVIPVVATDVSGRPLTWTNLGASAAQRGIAAPGDGITSLSPDGGAVTWSGTSVATAMVSGALALLWSEFPSVDAAHLRQAVTRPAHPGTLVPRLLAVQTAYASLARHAR
ncbi:S8 family serine peptidase [Streptomyces sp. NBC_00076]|uniref:S8 family serine peptidase n=1 Tax=Streptomyces sp. NBC_00076 TaxID=2975642 RepID=UPI00386A7F18